MANYLNARSYSLLLDALSQNEEAAASSFLKLRDTLVRFFQLKGDPDAIESADETLDRVAKKLESVVVEELTKYAFGVARLVFLENLRKSKKEAAVLTSLQLENERQSARIDDTDSFTHMRECFAELSDANKELMRSYFADLPRERLDEERQRMASSLGASQNNLRLKIFRLRRKLENCVHARR